MGTRSRKTAAKDTAVRKVARPNRGVSSDDAEIGRRIKLIRIERDMSQEALGKVLGVSFQQIQKYEKGANRVSSGRLMEIATALITTPHDLMGWNEKAPTVAIDAETYKLAKTFAALQPKHRRPVRLLIEGLMEDQV